MIFLFVSGLVSSAPADGSALTYAIQTNPTPAPTPDTTNEGETLIGDTDENKDGTEATSIESSAEEEVVSISADANVDSERLHDLLAEESIVAGWVMPSASSSQCAERGAGRFFESIGTWGPDICTAAWVCGGERIDEMVTGEISGRAATGRYREFLNTVVGYFAADVAVESGIGDFEGVNSYLLEQGLGNSHQDDQIPVFYWCGKQTEASSAVAFEMAPIDPARAPRLSWDTTIVDEYDIPGLRADVYARIKARVELSSPELGAVPPIDTGFTWVKWPTWFWVAPAQAPLEAFAQSSTKTLMLEMRALVERVEWRFDGELLKVCATDEMLAYDKQAHDPVADAPDCIHRFSKAVQGADLEATIFYKVEERVRRRNAKTDAYPASPWVPHPDTPAVPLTTTIADYGVHEILSVNTPINATDDEIAELLRND